MTIISRRKLTLHGKEFTLKVCYSNPKDDFYVPFPDYVADVLHKKEVRHDKRKMAEHDFWKAIEEYEEITQKKKKVIFYKFLSRVQPYGMPLGGFFSGMTAHESKGEMISFGIAMNLWFIVGYTFTRENGDVHYYDESMKMWGEKGNRHPRIMEWTEEREAFFHGFRDMMAEQITKMHEFFHNDKEDVPALIDLGMTGMKFLPHMEEEE